MLLADLSTTHSNIAVAPTEAIFAVPPFCLNRTAVVIGAGAVRDDDDAFMKRHLRNVSPAIQQ